MVVGRGALLTEVDLVKLQVGRWRGWRVWEDLARGGDGMVAWRLVGWSWRSRIEVGACQVALLCVVENEVEVTQKLAQR